jgi:futalosine hydrolase
MKIVITAATKGEWMPASLRIKSKFTKEGNPINVIFHESGVGMLSTAVSLMRLITAYQPDLIIQVGIAGTFDQNIKLGKVICVESEVLGDMGVEENNNWKDIFDLTLEQKNNTPFINGKLKNPYLKKLNHLQLPAVQSITVNQITTDKNRIQQLTKKYNPVIESMEGAALHYVCNEMELPFLQIRSISNYIGDRNKNNWRLKEAIGNLNKTVLTYIDQLNKKH